ncbi:MAG TPA: maleylpyruvate isomerase family mycothiol-dependent enzyme, partial [Acidimicrobiales bacterium]|nr:maleylpyruvate isomerase family mycothiol-dependent enzyme [Acidimicrobiales bacterium]
MAKTDTWPVIHAERKALASDLTGLPADGWSRPSLCAGWSIRDVLAHMTATAKTTPTSFFPKLMGSGFSFTRMQAKDIRAESGMTPEDTLAGFESVLNSKKRPPGPPAAILGETLVHSEDIRRALGIEHGYPMEAIVEVAEFYKGSNLLLGTKKRINGLRLQATDTDWSHGSGSEASGPMMSLVLAMTGRKA